MYLSNGSSHAIEQVWLLESVLPQFINQMINVISYVVHGSTIVKPKQHFAVINHRMQYHT